VYPTLEVSGQYRSALSYSGLALYSTIKTYFKKNSISGNTRVSIIGPLLPRPSQLRDTYEISSSPSKKIAKKEFSKSAQINEVELIGPRCQVYQSAPK